MTLFSVAPPPDPTLGQDSASGVSFAFERPQDGLAVEALIDRAFGPGRFAKTAERIREGARLRLDLSVCAWAGEGLVGAVRQWSIEIEGRRALFLGPIAVDEAERRHGLGAALMRGAIAAARAAGEEIVVLVGDMPYFAQFGFNPARGLVLPGPVDPQRLLWIELRAGALDGAAGAVRPLGGG